MRSSIRSSAGPEKRRERASMLCPGSTVCRFCLGTPREMYVGKLGPSLYRVGAKQNLQTVEPGQSIEARSRLFSGPAEERMLERIAPGLELVKDYGWMTLIAK